MRVSSSCHLPQYSDMGSALPVPDERVRSRVPGDTYQLDVFFSLSLLLFVALRRQRIRIRPLGHQLTSIEIAKRRTQLLVLITVIIVDNGFTSPSIPHYPRMIHECFWHFVRFFPK